MDQIAECYKVVAKQLVTVCWTLVCINKDAEVVHSQRWNNDDGDGLVFSRNNFCFNITRTLEGFAD